MFKLDSFGIFWICCTVVCAFGFTNCGGKTDPQEVKAISEACAKLGKEPVITVRAGDGVRMGCK